MHGAFMTDMPRTRQDLTAVALLLAGLAVALAVFSHDPADAPTSHVYPAHAEVTNLLGSGGAWLASALLDALGVGVYPLLAAWFVLVLLLLQRRDRARWCLRLFGWLWLVPATSAAADHWLAPTFGEATTGTGGSIGSWINLEWLAPFGGVVHHLVLGLSLSLGIVLAFGFALRKLTVLKAVGPAVWNRLSTVFRPRPRALISMADTEAMPFIRAVHEMPTKTAPRTVETKLPVPIHHTTRHPHALKEMAAEGDVDFQLPPLTLLEDPEAVEKERDDVLRNRAALLEKTFTDFGMRVKVVGIHTGPVITQFELSLETGLRLSKVTALADDLALNLMVPGVRIVAPLPGKNTVGIEVPNEHRAVVRLKEIILGSGFKPGGRTGWAAKAKIPLFLGKDTEGKPLVYDLAEMPHLLIAGRTGTGKSVCMNAIILSMLMARRPDELKLIMIDPKNGVELGQYDRIPHMMHPTIKDMDKAEAILAWAVDKMEERYDTLCRARVRHVTAYNELGREELLRRLKPADEEETASIEERMPYIVILIDEMADLMMQKKKEVEGHIIRLAQKSRAAGIHIVVATQKPIVDVITGLIKSNLPARISFQVSNRTDSRVVLDEMGADKLLGKGDMLFLHPGTSTLHRAQGAYVSDREIERVIAQLETDEPEYAAELVQLRAAGKGGNFLENVRSRDDLYEQAISIVVGEGRGSVSLLQRALGIGYGRAARMIDFMAEDGIVGASKGSQAREVLYTPEQWEAVRATGQEAAHS
jgi:S-DNA-T family DNA segregation ATPase FtsK/SpoIIIE